MKSYLGSEDAVRDLQPRFRMVYAVLGIVAVILTSRLWYLQVLEGQKLEEYSEKNRVKEKKNPAPRGLLLDREGRILVDNSLGFDVTITPQYTKNLEETATALAPVIGQPAAKILQQVKRSRRRSGPFFPARIKENLSLDEVYRVERLKIDHSGLNVEKTILRLYPLEESGAQLFGYVGEVSKQKLKILNKDKSTEQKINQGDIIGQSGLEEIWDDDLRGEDGLKFIEVDAHGRESKSQRQDIFNLKPIDPIHGKNLVLTIDKDIQIAAQDAMLNQKDKLGPRIGAAVAMTSAGEVLAWVITPSFNPNRFARGISRDLWRSLVDDPNKPLRNKIIQDHFAPGSTLKPIVALAALQEGIVTKNTIVHAPGVMKYGRRSYHDSLRGGHGKINIVRALESSSNVFFYKMGIGLGIDNMAKYAKLLGLGERTGFGFPIEAPGLFPTKAWKLKAVGEEWQPGENLSNAIGQGFVLVNLLQLTMAYNAIGLDGNLYRPYVIKQILDSEGKIIKSFEPTLIRDITDETQEVFVSPKHLKTVQEGLYQVANGEHGTARWWKIPGVKYAGKTGTSQVMSFRADDIYNKCNKRPFEQRHHGTFVAYAPAKSPEIVVAVLTEHSCSSTKSVPVVRDIMKAYFEKYRPELMEKKKTVAKASSEEAQ